MSAYVSYSEPKANIASVVVGGEPVSASGTNAFICSSRFTCKTCVQHGFPIGTGVFQSLRKSWMTFSLDVRRWSKLSWILDAGCWRSWPLQ